MTEFREWRQSSLSFDSPQRILWIRGPLGIGKSVMAGYFIELLKCLHPGSNVLYFFCKGGKEKLRKASDVLRTLAYQCSQASKPAHSVLQSLQCKDFQIDEDVGITFLFEKLLQEPLGQAQNETFIVLDGLDEADTITTDTTERLSKPKIHILIECLANLQTARLLLISRPEFNVSNIVPHLIVKSIGKDENIADINSYIQNVLNKAERLKRHFQEEQIYPYSYFHENGRGLFLWVVLALDQLAQAKATSVFRECLQGLADAPADMELLYSTVLSRVECNDRKWVAEILRWLVISKHGDFAMEELQQAVEWSLQDKLPEFQQFLDVDCGSFLRVFPWWPGSDIMRVQIFHETFRTFLTSSKACCEYFRINLSSAHGFALLCSIEVLSVRQRARVDTLISYASQNWLYHLVNAPTSGSQCLEILDGLHNFFESIGYRNWLVNSPRDICGSDADLMNRVLALHVEEKWCATIFNYLAQVDPSVHSETSNTQGDTVNGRNVKARSGFRWCEKMLKSPGRLEEYIAKKSAELWLYHDLRSFHVVSGSFRMALKYFCKSLGRPLCTIYDVQDVASDDFSALVNWMELKPKPQLNPLNLGIAYSLLRLWQDSISCFQAAKVTERRNAIFWEWFGDDCFHAKSYDAAIEGYRQAKGIEGVGVLDVRRVALKMGRAYEAKGLLDKAICSYEAGLGPVELNPLDKIWNIFRLGRLYASKNDHGSATNLYEKIMKIESNMSWAWQHLSDVYLPHGTVRVDRIPATGPSISNFQGYYLASPGISITKSLIDLMGIL